MARMTEGAQLSEFIDSSEAGSLAFERSDVMEPFSPSLLEELSPSTMLEGTCGVYLLKNKKGEDVGVFKPMDEEHVPEEAEEWALVKGHGSYRERAAFLVSSELGGYTGVPNTIITTLRHPTFEGGEKRGSLQRFVPASKDMSDLGPAGIPVDEVHKIGIVDLLLFNVDRHEGNVLLRTKKGDGSGTATRELVPIDHGLCLPVIVTKESGPLRRLMLDLYFAWQSWPQAKEPFGANAQRFLSALSPHAVTRIVKLVKKDLGRHAIPAPALTTLKVGALLLRLCAQSGKTLSAIADFVRMVLADVLEEAWLLAGHDDDHAVSHEAVSHEDTAASAPPAASTALVVRPEPTLDLDTSLDLEEVAYEAWERRLLAAFQVRLRAALNLVPVIDGGDDNEIEHENVLFSAVAAETTKETSPIERLDSPPGSPTLDGGSALEELEDDGKFALEGVNFGPDTVNLKELHLAGAAVDLFQTEQEPSCSFSGEGGTISHDALQPPRSCREEMGDEADSMLSGHMGAEVPSPAGRMAA
mmetsp:Transcript_50908/g.101707  ORF Transcript_50908/g.101707 Transcript_50908/m.101707 type:complete len:528 (-) Transcript_50908:159-1742(-)